MFPDIPKPSPPCQHGQVSSPSTRPYRGLAAADRQAQRRASLLTAGLAILGCNSAIEVVTVRGVCRRAGLTARYFYESFADKDEFVGAVFDWVVADLAATTQAAVAAVPLAQRTTAAMANIVRVIMGDPRVGRLLFSVELADPVLVRKRAESSALFAMLYGQHLGNALRLDEDDRIKATAHFVVGGVGQTLSAWLSNEIALTPEQLVGQLAALLNETADPAAFRAASSPR
jgi:AcrR family transcriptional regulator